MTTYRNRVYRNGVVVSEELVEVDTTIDDNKQAIEQRALTALTTNRDFLAVANPTNAQNAAQVKALTRQMNGVVRLLLAQLDSAD